MEGAAAGFAVFVGWKDGFTMMKIGVLALYALMMVAVIVLKKWIPFLPLLSKLLLLLM